jgi:hypothetical protein
MLKVRLQGTKEDIRWFVRLMERNRDMRLENTSDFYDNKGTERFKRVYTEVYRTGTKNI